MYLQFIGSRCRCADLDGTLRSSAELCGAWQSSIKHEVARRSLLYLCIFRYSSPEVERAWYGVTIKDKASGQPLKLTLWLIVFGQDQVSWTKNFQFVAESGLTTYKIIIIIIGRFQAFVSLPLQVVSQCLYVDAEAYLRLRNLETRLRGHHSYAFNPPITLIQAHPIA